MGCCKANNELIKNDEITKEEEKKEELPKTEVNPDEEDNEPKEEEDKYPKPDKDKETDYKEDVLNWINFIRTKPAEFIPEIEEAKGKIKEANGKKIYNGKVKVALKDGVDVFDEAIEVLKNTQPLQPLELCEDIVLKVPEDEEKAKDPKSLKAIVEEKKADPNFNIESYFKDSVKNAYISVLLLIIDDSGKKPRKKREAVLNPNYTRLGLDFQKFKKQFTAYYTFAGPRVEKIEEPQEQ